MRTRHHRSPSSSGIIAVLAGMTLVGGCRSPDEESLLSQPLELPTALEGGIGLPAAAVEAIAERHCDRYQRCGRIGLGQRYAQRVECLIQIRGRWADELNVVACPRGVHEGKLAVCLRELEVQPCSALDGPDPSLPCRALAICDTPAPAPAVLPPIRPVPER